MVNPPKVATCFILPVKVCSKVQALLATFISWMIKTTREISERLLLKFCHLYSRLYLSHGDNKNTNSGSDARHTQNTELCCYVVWVIRCASRVPACFAFSLLQQWGGEHSGEPLPPSHCQKKFCSVICLEAILDLSMCNLKIAIRTYSVNNHLTPGIRNTFLGFSLQQWNFVVLGLQINEFCYAEFTSTSSLDMML